MNKIKGMQISKIADKLSRISTELEKLAEEEEQEGLEYGWTSCKVNVDVLERISFELENMVDDLIDIT